MNDILFIFIIALIVVGGMFGVFLLTREKIKVDQKQTEAMRDIERGLTSLMAGQLKEIRGSVDGTSKAMYQQISSFTRETVQIREEMKQVQEVMKEISSFQEFFKSPKIRGQWGEASLIHILSEYFPKELYQAQYLFSSGEQVDAVLRLPNKKIISIDAKFPFDNFRRMVEAELKEEKDEFRKKFIEDSKRRIQEIASKYILPSEDTVDLAIMYIPAEAVYYELNMLKEVDIGSYARSRKIVLTSPNTIFLALRAIEHWYKDVQVSQRTAQILKRLARIQLDGVKLMNDFRKLGGHLRNAISSYDNSEKRLSLFDDRLERLLETSKSDKKLVNKIIDKS